MAEKKISTTKKVLTYTVLTGFGLTMIIPFLWMVSTALKPREQAFRANWIPTENRVRYNGDLVNISKMHPAAEKPGIYRVKIVSGPEAGKIIDVSTSRLTMSVVSKTLFSYQAEVNDNAKTIYDVRLIKKIKPMYYNVQIINPRQPATTVNLELAEDKIVKKVAPKWNNFARAIKTSGVFGRSYINSIVVAVIVTLGQVFTSSLAAYAFARLKFPGRDPLFMGYLATMMIPGAVTMIPVFIILKAMPEILNSIFTTEFFSSSLYFQFSPHAARFYAGKPIGLDSYFALIAPGLFSAYGTFMLRQFFMSLPADLEDAAKIDGCSLFRVYTNVILPLSKPALATLTIVTFMGAWRNFLWPMVVTSTPTMQTLPVMLTSFMGVTSTQWELLMAGSLMVIAPLLVVFLVGQRFFIEGIQLGAVKG